LETAWVEANFNKKFLHQIKNLSGKTVAYISVLPGEDRNILLVHFEELAVGPKINMYKVLTRELAWCIQWPV
jgi:hypothetical protein